MFVEGLLKERSYTISISVGCNGSCLAHLLLLPALAVGGTAESAAQLAQQARRLLGAGRPGAPEGSWAVAPCRRRWLLLGCNLAIGKYDEFSIHLICHLYIPWQCEYSWVAFSSCLRLHILWPILSDALDLQQIEVYKRESAQTSLLRILPQLRCFCMPISTSTA